MPRKCKCGRSYRVFIRVHGCYFEGRMPGSGVGGNSGITCVYVEEVVLQEVENDPSTSTRVIARHTCSGNSTVHDILKKKFSLFMSHAFKLSNQDIMQVDSVFAGEYWRSSLTKFCEAILFVKSNLSLWQFGKTNGRKLFIQLAI